MITKYCFGTPFETEAVTMKLKSISVTPSNLTKDVSKDMFLYPISINANQAFTLEYDMAENDIVYGLGEANRGINKRGYQYISYCTDDPNHTENKYSLYGAHNFIIIDGNPCFGLFLDYPGKLTFDIGYSSYSKLRIVAEEANLYLYVISGTSPYDIVKQFREMIGESYLPPLWAFGYQQSRWGYKTADDIRAVADGYQNRGIGLDAIYMDIDYMERYKDFTIDEERFPDFPEFVSEMKNRNLHLVPIIDAGVKIEDGYSVYEEGVANNYFCKREDGTDFIAGVWPGDTHFPDFFKKETRTWFGNKYDTLLEKGIDGFWNDMNEPAIFYSKEGLTNTFAEIKKLEEKELDLENFFYLKHLVDSLQNNEEDYKRFYHDVNGNKVRHDKVHNLYGYYMTRAAGEAFQTLSESKRVLLFSRSSYIGMHRYGGIWTGDNQSWWSHLLLNIKMMPSLNMCGFLYSGADLGGFGSNVTRDLMLRWLAFGIFTPLMRNHSAIGTRNQECYEFESTEEFKHLIGIRYRLIPYLYSEFVKAVKKNDMLFRPLAFDYPDNKQVRHIEDQLMLGDGLMITPVYTQNTTGRYVYLPEDMLYLKFTKDSDFHLEVLTKGHHYIEVGLSEVPLFIKPNHILLLAKPAKNTATLDRKNVTLLCYLTKEASYEFYEDDGITLPANGTITNLSMDCPDTEKIINSEFKLA